VASKLLISEEPLQVLPSLAVLIGLPEAMVLQQLHYWLKKSKHEHDGRAWVYNTLGEWQSQFPFWSESVLQRTMKSLSDQGLVRVHKFNKENWDRTNWYTIEYEAVDNLVEKSVEISETCDRKRITIATKRRLRSRGFALSRVQE
jgi:hypothetical protein